MEIADVLRRLRPILGEAETHRRWEQLQLVDPKTAKLVEFSLRRRLAEATGTTFEDRDILLEPIPEDLAMGEIALGRVFFGTRDFHPFGLRRSELIQHLAVFGRSGAGKTNVAFLLLRELARLRVPFLAFDWKKNFRDLLRLPDFERLVVYTVGREEAPFFFNPLVPPPGTPPKEWLKRLIDVACSAYYLGEGVAFLLQEELDALYRDFGLYERELPQVWPTFRDLLFRLQARSVKGREAQWMESVMRAIGVLTFGAMDWVLNSGAMMPIEQVLRQHAVLELDALSQSDKRFLIETLLLWIHHFRMNEGGREILKHVLVIEEAHHILLARAGGGGDESPMDVLVREVREFGEAIVFLDQLPSLISKPALENTFTTISMNLKEQGDVTAAGRSMLLSSEQTKHLGRLPVGHAIVKLQGRWVRPFLVRFPLFEVEKGTATGAQVHARFLATLDVRTTGRLMKQAYDATMRLVPRGTWMEAAATVMATGPDERERELLEDVSQYPTSNVTNRYARLGLTADKGTRLVSRLLDRELLRETVLRVDRSNLRLLELTGPGREVVGLKATGTERRGGVVHQFWVERIAGHLREAGWNVEVEAPLGAGKTVDLLATVGGRRVAVEVETGASDWKANLEKTRGSVALVAVACTTKKLAQVVESKLDQEDLARVLVGTPDDVATLISKKWPDSGASEQIRGSSTRTRQVRRLRSAG